MELSRFLQIALNNKKIIFWFALTISIVVFLVGYVFSKYEVETNVLIKPLGSEAQVNVGKSSPGLISSPDLRNLVDLGNSYVNILTNRNLISEVVTRLELDKAYFEEQSFPARLINNIKQPLRFIKYGRLPATPKNPFERAVKRLMKNIGATLYIRSSIIRVTVKDKDAYLAAVIANTLADSFLDYTKENSTQVAKTTRKFIEHHLVETRSELESNKEIIKKLKADHGLFAFSDFSKEMVRIKEKLERIEKEYENQNYRLEIIKDTLAMIKDEISKYSEYKISIYTLNSNPTLKDLKRDLFKLKIDLQQLLIDYSPQNLRVKAQNDRIAMTEKAISSEVERFLTSEEYKINPIHKSLLDKQLSLDIELKTIPFLNKQLFERTKKYSDRLMELEAISSEVSNVNNNIANLLAQEKSLLNDLYSAKALEARGQGEVIILDRAVAPRYPVMKGQALFVHVIVGFISGLIFGSFLIILQTQQKGTIIDENDIIKEGICPSTKIVSIHMVKTRQRQENKMQTLEISNQLYGFILNSRMKEEFRRLAAHFYCSAFMNSSASKCLCVTSSLSKEGTTTIAANFAVALAILSRKVAIVDCQNVSPKINELFGVQMKEGLVEYLENPSPTMVDKLIKPSATKGLFVVTYGNAINKEDGLFYDQVINSLLRELKNRFDYVILDCPPVIDSAESLSVAINSEVDGSIVVVQGNRTRKSDFIKTCSYIESVNTKILAVICNRI